MAGPALHPASCPVTFIGAGAVTGALARHVHMLGYRIATVISRSRPAVEHLAMDVHATHAGTDLQVLAPETRLVCCCVPDDALPHVAQNLATVPHAWPETAVLHTSGALTAEVLAPLAEAGATVLSFHPLHAFTRSRPADLYGIRIGVEGTQEGVAFGQALAVAWRMEAVVVPTEAKVQYHLAAAMASNFLVTLAALAREVLVTAGIDPVIGMRMLQPLIEGTVQNLGHASPEEALTGPIVRGDVDTVRQHSVALLAHAPQLIPAFTVLATETIKLAMDSGRLPPDQAQVLLDHLHHLVTWRDVNL